MNTNRTPSRWLEAIGISAFLGAMLTMGTGCGAIAAAANPKVAWALNDPAPMSVVVRRADVAEKTSKEVDRLMTDTPVADDAQWLGKVGPEKDAATKDMTDLRANDLYSRGSRVVAAEVWAKELAQVEPKNAKPSAAPATPANNATADASDTKVAVADKKGAKKGKGKGAKGKSAKSSKTDDKAEAKAKITDGAPATTDAALAATSSTPKYANILAAIDPDLGTEWSKVMEKKKALGDTKSQIAVLEAANDEKGISDADKKANKAKISELEKQADALEDEANKLAKAFIPKAKSLAQKAAPEVREKVGVTLVNLFQATEDANISNGAAAVRYPLAATTLLDSAKQMAKIYVADVVEEKTGKRPITSTLVPGVTMEGGNVEVTLNGLTKSDLGQLSIGDVTKEVAKRTSAWAKRAVGLLGIVSSTKEVLEFEGDVLKNLIDGFKAAGWAPPPAATIPEAPPPAGGQPRA